MIELRAYIDGKGKKRFASWFQSKDIQDAQAYWADYKGRKKQEI